MSVISLTVNLITIDCGQCGGTYAINERYYARKKESGGGWNCPYCQWGWGFFGETEAQRLKKQLEAKDMELSSARCEANRQTTLREYAERERKKSERKIKRSNNGVCTCCNRSFRNLARHMATKHGANNLPKKPEKKK